MLEWLTGYFAKGKMKALRLEYEDLKRRQKEIAKEKAVCPDHARALELEKELALSKDRCEYLGHVLKLKSVEEEVKDDLSCLEAEELGGKKR